MSKKIKENITKEPERLVSVFDPTANAYREVPESLARKFIESAKEVEKKLEAKK